MSFDSQKQSADCDVYVVGHCIGVKTHEFCGYALIDIEINHRPSIKH